VELPNKLKLAVIWDDGMVRPTPPILRALRETKAKLEAAGHEVINWDAKDHSTGFTMMMYLLGADGCKSLRQPIESAGEPWLPQMKVFQNIDPLSTFDTWQLQHKRSEFQGQYHDAWRAAGIDAILSPTMPFVTARHGQSKHSEYRVAPLTRLAEEGREVRETG
jgi:amidase